MKYLAFIAVLLVSGVPPSWADRQSSVVSICGNILLPKLDVNLLTQPLGNQESYLFANETQLLDLMLEVERLLRTTIGPEQQNTLPNIYQFLRSLKLKERELFKLINQRKNDKGLFASNDLARAYFAKVHRQLETIRLQMVAATINRVATRSSIQISVSRANVMRESLWRRFVVVLIEGFLSDMVSMPEAATTGLLKTDYWFKNGNAKVVIQTQKLDTEDVYESNLVERAHILRKNTGWDQQATHELWFISFFQLPASVHSRLSVYYDHVIELGLF